MDIDRRTKLIFAHEEEYRAFPVFQKMVDNTQFIPVEEKEASLRYLDTVYGTELVDRVEREAHGT